MVYASCNTGVKGGVYKTKRGKRLESEEGKGSQNGGRGIEREEVDAGQECGSGVTCKTMIVVDTDMMMGDGGEGRVF